MTAKIFPKFLCKALAKNAFLAPLWLYQIKKIKKSRNSSNLPGRSTFSLKWGGIVSPITPTNCRIERIVRIHIRSFLEFVVVYGLPHRPFRNCLINLHHDVHRLVQRHHDLLVVRQIIIRELVRAGLSTIFALVGNRRYKTPALPAARLRSSNLPTSLASI